MLALHSIVATFLMQSFSAASAVQTDSSFGLKIAFFYFLHTTGGYL